MTKCFINWRIAIFALLVTSFAGTLAGDCMLAGGWGVSSPAPGSDQPYNANLSIGGDADEEGVSWVCTITDSGGQTGNSTAGSSVCEADTPKWSGTYIKPPMGWNLGMATIEITVAGEVEASEDFNFIK